MKLYRARAYIYDEFIDPTSHNPLFPPTNTFIGWIIYDEYEVLKQTPKGFQINVFEERKFVLAGEGHRFAYPTKEAALASLKRRTKRRLEYAERNLKIANLILNNFDQLDGI